MKYWLKQCPKCNGDLRQELDAFGTYVECVQCGFIATATQEAALVTTGSLAPAQIRIEEPQHEAVAAQTARKAA